MLPLALEEIASEMTFDVLTYHRFNENIMEFNGKTYQIRRLQPPITPI
jgi:hypothetical protein